MRKLNFNVTAQIIEGVGDFSDIVSGTTGYLHAVFSFSEEWAKCTKIATFWYKNQECAVRLKDDQCEIPPEVLVGSHFKVQVTGVRDGYRISTDKFKVKQKEV